MAYRSKFFRVPFATAGDKTPIPDPVQVSGTMSFTQGWGVDYQRDLASDPLAKPIDRAEMNALFSDVTIALRYWQTETAPEWIAAADNDGAAFPYDKGAIVRFRLTTDVPFMPYVSLVAANVAAPNDATKWQPLIYEISNSADAIAGARNDVLITPLRLAQVLAGSVGSRYNVGDVFYCASVAPPALALVANGGAVNRTIYAALFARIGTTYGVGDGSTTFNLPDARGEAIRGFDNGRGVDPGRVFGSSQLDSMQGHYHTARNAALPLGGGASFLEINPAYALNGGNVGIAGPITDGTNGTPRIASETRMRNIALLPCIQYQ